MRAAVLAVGSELLGTDRLDTNSLATSALLRRYGATLVRKAVVGDEEEEIAREVRALVGRFELVVVSGGLGPTADDLTREGVAAALDRTVVLDAEVLAELETKWAAFGRSMPSSNRRQARVLAGASVLGNDRGTAPGLRVEEGGTTIFLLPGVPREFHRLLEREVEPWVAERMGGESAYEELVLKVACVAESEVESRIGPAYEAIGRERVTVLASPGEVRIVVAAAGRPDDRRRQLAAAGRLLRELLGQAVFSSREDEELEAVVGGLLAARGATIATCESCTGGGLAARLTAIPGSSAYVVGALVCYSNEAKARLADVPAQLIVEHGAVSEAVARAMAAGARRATGADYAVGITGIAGPDGGTEEKPVGTVDLALDGPGPRLPIARRVVFPGDRERIRRQTTQLALELLRRELLAE